MPNRRYTGIIRHAPCIMPVPPLGCPSIMPVPHWFGRVFYVLPIAAVHLHSTHKTPEQYTYNTRSTCYESESESSESSVLFSEYLLPFGGRHLDPLFLSPHARVDRRSGVVVLFRLKKNNKTDFQRYTAVSTEKMGGFLDEQAKLCKSVPELFYPKLTTASKLRTTTYTPLEKRSPRCLHPETPQTF